MRVLLHNLLILLFIQKQQASPGLFSIHVHAQFIISYCFCILNSQGIPGRKKNVKVTAGFVTFRILFFLSKLPIIYFFSLRKADPRILSRFYSYLCYQAKVWLLATHSIIKRQVVRKKSTFIYSKRPAFGECGRLLLQNPPSFLIAFKKSRIKMMLLKFF